jgi:signal transduction histidine kinase
MRETQVQPQVQTQPLRVLLVDDSETDAQLIHHYLREDGFAPYSERVANGDALRDALSRSTWDVVLCDFAMPGFSGPEALRILQDTGKDIPFIVVTGTIGEEAAVNMMKSGAQDFLLKDRASRLGPAIRRELRDAQGRRQQRADAHAREVTQQQLGVAYQQLRMMSGQIMQVQERERALLSRGLHDDVGQALTGLQLQLEAMRRRATTAPDLKSADDCILIVGQLLQQVRDLSLDLRPPQLDTIGLTAALRWYAARRIAAAPGLTLEFHAQTLPTLHPDVETTCFRIVQEALTNVLRHAQASVVSLDVRHVAEELQVTVGDNGVGFDVSGSYERAVRGGSLGLLNMQERAGLMGGRVELISSSGDTRILIRLPFAPLVVLQQPQPGESP